MVPTGPSQISVWKFLMLVDNVILMMLLFLCFLRHLSQGPASDD